MVTMNTNIHMQKDSAVPCLALQWNDRVVSQSRPFRCTLYFYIHCPHSSQRGPPTYPKWGPPKLMLCVKYRHIRPYLSLQQICQGWGSLPFGYQLIQPCYIHNLSNLRRVLSPSTWDVFSSLYHNHYHITDAGTYRARFLICWPMYDNLCRVIHTIMSRASIKASYSDIVTHPLESGLSSFCPALFSCFAFSLASAFSSLFLSIVYDNKKEIKIMRRNIFASKDTETKNRSLPNFPECLCRQIWWT